MNALMDVDQTW